MPIKRKEPQNSFYDSVSEALLYVSEYADFFISCLLPLLLWGASLPECIR